MKSKNDIKSLYKFSLFCNLCFVFICMAVLIFLTVFAFTGSLKQNFQFIAICIAFMGILALLICSVLGLVPILKDYKNYKSKQFSRVRGRIIGFEKNISPDTGKQWNDKPIIRTEEGERIVLHLNKTLEREKTYTFIYLPNTKIAVSIEE